MPNTSRDLFKLDPPDLDKVALIAGCAAQLANECVTLGYDPLVIVTANSDTPVELVLTLAHTLPLTHDRVKPILLRALAIYMMPNAELSRLNGNSKRLANRLRKIAKGLTDYSDILLGATAIVLTMRSVATLMPHATVTSS